MQLQERELITGLFERLRPLAAQQRDRDAEKLIAGLVAENPAAPYLLTQTLLVQEQALQAAQDRIADLEGRPRGSFLQNAPDPSPWNRQAAPERGGSFLSTALATAAGVAGGALMFEGIRNLLGHNPGPFGRSVGESSAMLGQDLGPPSQLSSADLAQDEGAADDYDLTDDTGDII
ncbi:MAG TPA: DUF2076 family protein [Reyranellaceae bacterium]|nr:DUF2076 family protein [Reyranellaceae bacterium]